jgi:hypothetical protein
MDEALWNCRYGDAEKEGNHGDIVMVHGLNREGKSGGGLVSRGWPARSLAYSC